jgi:hypothetical protein
MRILNEILPMFLLIQFLVVLTGMLAALLLTNPEVSRPGSRLARGYASLVSILTGVARLFSR